LVVRVANTTAAPAATYPRDAMMYAQGEMIRTSSIKRVEVSFLTGISNLQSSFR
jgi:hypothetical protein